jgi:hypothetical protein
MHGYTISVRAAVGRHVVEERLRVLAAGGAFRVREIATVGVGLWAFGLQQVRPELAVGFGKVAEFLVLLPREFDVHAVERSPSHAIAAAS